MRKIISSKIKTGEAVKAEEKVAAKQTESDSVITGIKAKKVCFFCEAKTLPSYTDAMTLRRFTNDRAKIVNHARTGVCSKHQRRVTREIKHARHLALLPFTPKV